MNKQAILKRMIILCWILLAVCFIIKLFGGNWFEIVVTNQKFIILCNFIDRNTILKITIGIISSYSSLILLYLIICQKKSFTIKMYLTILLITICCVVVKYFYKKFGLLLDIIQAIIFPLFITKNYLNIFIINALFFLFQIISILTKNLGFNFLDTSTLISLIFMVDYYIMLLLTYLYCRRYNFMGVFGLWFLSDDITQLKAFKETCKTDKEKARVQKRIDKLTAKQKNAKV